LPPPKVVRKTSVTPSRLLCFGQAITLKKGFHMALNVKGIEKAIREHDGSKHRKLGFGGGLCLLEQ
jgi:hypothetical protein